MSDIPDLSLDALCARIQARELDPCEVVEAYLERIEASDGALNAYVTVAVDRARDRARESRRRHRPRLLRPNRRRCPRVAAAYRSPSCDWATSG